MPIPFSPPAHAPESSNFSPSSRAAYPRWAEISGVLRFPERSFVRGHELCKCGRPSPLDGPWWFSFCAAPLRCLLRGSKHGQTHIALRHDDHADRLYCQSDPLGREPQRAMSALRRADCVHRCSPQPHSQSEGRFDFTHPALSHLRLRTDHTVRLLRRTDEPAGKFPLRSPGRLVCCACRPITAALSCCPPSAVETCSAHAAGFFAG